ncbi:Cytochrome P450 monooxygenase hepE [Cladobotryum mycophilum]|uniref:Cytochrome P450 monooxygenase hepE n=1 Tax=Cladobotryum mycophilum TaxID=491253 RepID=A0ABR0T0S4_9HYPO
MSSLTTPFPLLEDWPQSMPMPSYEMSPYVATAFLGVLLAYIWLASSSDIKKLPSINPVGLFGSETEAKRQFLLSSTHLFKKARELFPDQPYRMLTDLGDVVVLPHRLVDEIRNEAKLSFPAANLEDFHGSIPGFEAMSQFANDDQLLEAVLRKRLTTHLSKVTEPLAEEMAIAASVNLGDSHEWTEMTLKPAILDIVARISSRVFLGDQLCRDAEWLNITKQYTINLFYSAAKLRVYPRNLRKLFHWFLPECKALRAQYREAERVIAPVIAKRREIRRMALADGKLPPYFNDALDWADEEATRKGLKFNMPAFQLMLSVGATHTTTDLLAQVMLDLAQNPEYMQLAREEILLDSIAKESQRLKPVSLAAMRRMAIDNVTLSNGLVIPKGARTFVDAYRMRDPDAYENPEKWDGSRFLKLRSQSGKDSMSLLVSTHRDHLGFGHGVWACPGRFFAANEVKVALCHILIKYEWKLSPGTDVKPMIMGAATGVSPTAKVLIRKREKMELDIDSL